MIPEFVRMVEVGPRDGLQNEGLMIPTEKKIELINRLSETGLARIEVSSFVSPKWVPQLKDAATVLLGIQKYPGVSYSVLVPNLQGFEKALAAGVESMALMTAASNSFSLKNTQCSIEESLKRIEAILPLALERGIFVRAYISCVLGCPYEGEISAESVLRIAERLYHLGCQEIALGDTIGVGTPLKAKRLIETLANKLPIEILAVHFHDTYGQALANIFACLEMGISVVDSSVGGLGGCPYAKGASGNVASEDLLYMLNGMTIKTGVDLGKLLSVSEFVSRLFQRPSRSKLFEACFRTSKKSFPF